MVVVVERNDWIGGAAVSRSLFPGFTSRAFINLARLKGLPP